MKRKVYEKYEPKKIVHAWELPIYVRVKKNFTKEIERLIISDSSFLEFSEKTKITRSKIYAICKEQRIMKTRELIRKLELPKDGKEHQKITTLLNPLLKKNVIKRINFGLYELR
jgi:predicted DNA-binding protein YlxM (UPF0122 family)